jgi:hypothetical protein
MQDPAQLFTLWREPAEIFFKQRARVARRCSMHCALAWRCERCEHVA